MLALVGGTTRRMSAFLTASLLATGTSFPGPAEADSQTPRPLVVTVDDLPVAGGGQEDPRHRLRVTDALLAHLRRHRIRAVGFVVGSNVRDETGRAILERWLAEFFL